MCRFIFLLFFLILTTGIGCSSDGKTPDVVNNDNSTSGDNSSGGNTDSNTTDNSSDNDDGTTDENDDGTSDGDDSESKDDTGDESADESGDDDDGDGEDDNPDDDDNNSDDDDDNDDDDESNSGGDDDNDDDDNDDDTDKEDDDDTGDSEDDDTGDDEEEDTEDDRENKEKVVVEDETECADFPWTVETKPINMLILLDRSKSMERYTVEGSTDTYADVVKAALDSVVQQHTNSGIINFALNVFPSPAMCDIEYGNKEAEEQSAAILCQAASQYTLEKNPFNDPEVPFGEEISVATYDTIHQVLNEVGNCGGTPITKSLQWARTYLNSLELEDDTYILLATDGAPGCNLAAELPCESATPGRTAGSPAECLDDLDSIHAIFDLAKDGYKTFMVGVGADVEAFADVMDVIAYTGGGLMREDQESIYDIDPPPSGEHWYYPAADAATLSSALEEVTNEAISCVFEVDWASIPDEDANTDQLVAKSCSQTRVFGIPVGSDSKTEITYMESCRDEDPESDDERLRMGWTWEELEGTSWEDVEAIGTDVSQCTRVKLCENACSKLKTIQGVKAWDGVSASFGCQPIIVIVV